MTASSTSDDRPFVFAVSLSLACHVIVLGVQFIRWHGAAVSERLSRAHVVYEATRIETTSQPFSHRLAALRGGGAGGPATETPLPQIRIAERAAMTFSGMQAPGIAPTRPAVVDLTNLAEAARGDPVLLSYFSAIREQIQKTANGQSWIVGQAVEGIVYIAFTLNQAGRVSSAAIVPERSASSQALQDVALKIIRASSPFAPFPPSAADSSKTIVVPLEFLPSP